MTPEMLEAEITRHNQALRQDLMTLRVKTHPKVIKDQLKEVLGPTALIKGVIHMINSIDFSTNDKARLKEEVVSAASSAKEIIEDVSDDIKGTVQSASKNVKDTLQSGGAQAVESIKSTVDTATHAAQEGVASAAKGLKDQATQIKEDVSSVGQTVSQQLKDGTHHVKALATDNPWTTILIASGAALTVAGIAIALSAGQRKQPQPQHDMHKALSRFEDDGNPNTSLLEEKPKRKPSHVSSTETQTGIANLLQEWPLLVGSAALLFGATIGILLPRSSYEDNLLGDSSDRLIESVKDSFSETLQEVKVEAKKQVDDLKHEAAETGKEVRQAFVDSFSSV